MEDQSDNFFFFLRILSIFKTHTHRERGEGLHVRFE